MAIAQPTYPIATSDLVTYIGGYVDGRVIVADSKNQRLRVGNSETFSRLGGLAAQSALVSGVLRLSALMYIPAGMAVNGLACWSAAAGATMTNQWFCLVGQTDLTVKAVTTDDTTAAWPANTKKRLAIAGGAWTPTTDQWCYFGVMVAGTTVPSIFGASVGNVGPAGDAPVICGGSNTGLTTPLAVGTVVSAPSGGTGVLYGYAD